MRFPKDGMIGAAILGAVGLAGAHLASGSLTINGGAAVAAGANITVGWKVATSHGSPINIDVSSDGGTTWKSLKAGLTDAAGTATSKVDMPAQATTHAKIRICQGSSANCDTVTGSFPNGVASGPSKTTVYTLVSSEFTIAGTSNLARVPSGSNSIQMSENGRTVRVSFALEHKSEVQVQAFDFQGRQLATLTKGNFEPGQHSLTLKSPENFVSSPAILYRLKIGETFSAQTLVLP